MPMLWTVVGLLIIVITLRDVAHELFHPEQNGSISRGVMKGIWAICRRLGMRFPAVLKHAGPAMIVAVAGVWVALAVLGWALIYWPRLPIQYNVDPALPAAATRGLLAALYISLGEATTLGVSDMTPIPAMLRYATALEALVGLVILTAWITWVLSIFPVLSARRVFSRELALLRRTQEDPEATIGEMPAEVLAALLRTLTERVLCTHAELVQSPVTYYFQQRESKSSLAAQLPWLVDFGRAAEDNGSPVVRHYAKMLSMALDDFIAHIGKEFLDLEDVPEDIALDAFVRDHMREREVSQSAVEGALEHTR